MKHKKGDKHSHVNIESMWGRDQSQKKNKKSLKKVSPFRIDIPKSHNNDIDKLFGVWLYQLNRVLVICS